MRRVRPVKRSAPSRLFHHIIHTELGRLRLLISCSIAALLYLSHAGTSQLTFSVPPAIFVCEVLIIFSVGLFSIVYAFELSSISRRISIQKPRFQRSNDERLDHRVYVAKQKAIKL